MDLTVRSESFQQEDQRWLGSDHGTTNADPVTITLAAGFVAGTHYPNGYLPSGTRLGKVTATGKYGLYDNAVSDGRETLVGLLFTDVPIKSPAAADVVGAMLLHCHVREAFLPFAIDSAGKADVAGRIIFSA